jgi:hypothetical protein
MSHKCHECECKHETIRFCRHCNKPYCVDCGKEWEEPCTRSHNYYPWYGGYIYTDYTKPNYATTTTVYNTSNATPTYTCAHSEES